MKLIVMTRMHPKIRPFLSARSVLFRLHRLRRRIQRLRCRCATGRGWQRERSAAEAGGDDDGRNRHEPAQWPLNLGSSRDWGFVGQPTPAWTDGVFRSAWARGSAAVRASMSWCGRRGHKEDWDHFAAEAGDDAWGYRVGPRLSIAGSKIGRALRTERVAASEGRHIVAQPRAPQPIAKALSMPRSPLSAFPSSIARTVK